MRNRYLTDLAVKKRAWHIPVGILSVLLAALTVEVWIEDSPADENPVTWLLAWLAVMSVMLVPLYRIVRWRLRQRDARRIADNLIGRSETTIPRVLLSEMLGIKNADAKIEDLKRRGFLQRIELDNELLTLDNPEPAAPQQPEETGEGNDVIACIRRLNDEIDDDGVSQRIERIEQVTASILDTLEQRPDRADDARRFMNYYLPTTLKLLESYRLMEKQSYQGKNILISRHRIEEVLDRLVEVTERQQDRLFGPEALDVEAEIRVLETMMTADGLTVARDA